MVKIGRGKDIAGGWALGIAFIFLSFNWMLSSVVITFMKDLD